MFGLSRGGFITGCAGPSASEVQGWVGWGRLRVGGWVVAKGYAGSQAVIVAEAVRFLCVGKGSFSCAASLDKPGTSSL